MTNTNIQAYVAFAAFNKLKDNSVQAQIQLGLDQLINHIYTF